VAEQVAVLKFAVKQIQVLSFKMNFNLLAQVVALLHIYTGGLRDPKAIARRPASWLEKSHLCCLVVSVVAMLNISSVCLLIVSYFS